MMRNLITYFRSRSNQVFSDFGLEIPDLAHRSPRNKFRRTWDVWESCILTKKPSRSLLHATSFHPNRCWTSAVLTTEFV